MSRRSSTDLCGGRLVTAVPTAILKKSSSAAAIVSLRGSSRIRSSLVLVAAEGHCQFIKYW